MSIQTLTIVLLSFAVIFLIAYIYSLHRFLNDFNTSSAALVKRLRNGIEKTDDVTDEELIHINNGLKIAANIIESESAGFPQLVKEQVEVVIN